MSLIKINKIVSMYEKPVYGSIKSDKLDVGMALSIDQDARKPFKGIIRTITKREGYVDIPGYIDESKLIIVKSNDGLDWKKVRDLEIKGIEKVIESLCGKEKYFVGLEDPDIWTDEKGMKHVYFTIAFKFKEKGGSEVYLGHAQGDNLETLTATLPVLSPIREEIRGFKEVTISPIKTKNDRINLTEMGIVGVSVISVVKAKNMSEPWKYLDIVLDPKKMSYSWCQEHVSPCCFLPKDFISIDNLLVGIINGRESTKIIDDEIVYRKFRPGLILFDSQTGKIPWVDSEPLFEDPDATTITFASDFLRTGNEKGILYAHVNDSFVRAYDIDVNKLKSYLKEKIKL